MASRAKSGQGKARRGAGEARRLRALKMHAAGVSGVEIARKLRVHPSTVSVWLHEPEAEKALERAKDRTEARMDADLEAVGGVVLDIALGRMGGATVADRLRAAVAIMDRRGVVPGQRLEHEGLGDPMSVPIDVLEERVRARLKRPGADNGEHLLPKDDDDGGDAPSD